MHLDSPPMPKHNLFSIKKWEIRGSFLFQQSWVTVTIVQEFFRRQIRDAMLQSLFINLQLSTIIILEKFPMLLPFLSENSRNSSEGFFLDCIILII